MCRKAIIADMMWVCLWSAENEVILDLDIQKVSGGNQHTGECQIFRRGEGITRRMVVAQHNAVAGALDGTAEDFTCVDKRPVKKTEGDPLLLDDLVAGIQHDDMEFLL